MGVSKAFNTEGTESTEKTIEKAMHVMRPCLISARSGGKILAWPSN